MSVQSDNAKIANAARGVTAACRMAAHGMAAPRLVIIAEFHVKPECVAECERVLCESARASRAEPGCMRFDVLRDQTDPARRGGRL